MKLISKNGKLYGLLPDGSWKIFSSEKQYEDEYYDMVFQMYNCFSIELPEGFTW